MLSSLEGEGDKGHPCVHGAQIPVRGGPTIPGYCYTCHGVAGPTTTLAHTSHTAEKAEVKIFPVIPRPSRQAATHPKVTPSRHHL